MPHHPEEPFDLADVNEFMSESSAVQNRLDENARQPNDSSAVPLASNQPNPVQHLENITQVVVADDTDFKAQVLKQLEDIKIMLAQQAATMGSILESINIGVSHGPTNSTAASHVIPINLLPCKQPHELESLEETISHDMNFRDKLMGRLALAGGNSVEESVGLILSTLMTDDLMASCNLKGKGKTGKQGINKFPKLLATIFDGLLLNPRTKANANIPAMNEAMSKSLKRADDRVRQRKKPKTCEQNAEPVFNPV